MPRTLLRSDLAEFELKLIHEIFHVLQYAHNARLSTRWGGDFDAAGNRVYEKFWFVEATATWAETFFNREDSVMVHSPRFDAFQQAYAELPLHAPTPKDHHYAAYIWPFFMEQKASELAIANAWRALAAVPAGDWDGAMRAIDRQVPFDGYFRDFAVRNVNEDLPGDPLKPMYQELDNNVPLGIHPRWTRHVYLTGMAKQRGEAPYREEATIRSLAASYHAYEPAEDVRQVTFTFNGLQPVETLDVDALIKLKGREEWERRPLSPDRELRFCFNKPDEDLEEIRFVFSNHSMEFDTTVAGEFTLLPLREPCGDYRIAGSYEMGPLLGPTWKSVHISGEFSFSDEAAASDEPAGSGTFTAVLGRFGPDATGCAPAGYDHISGAVEIAATVADGTLVIMVVPMPPPDADLRAFDLLDTAGQFQFGGKVFEVPVEGGFYAWGGGTTFVAPDEIDGIAACGSVPLASSGTFTVVKLADE
jgi:hypothetical protein